jgi:hypothetical protein
VANRRDAEGEKTAKLIRETGAECLYVHSDGSSGADVDRKNAVQEAARVLKPNGLLFAANIYRLVYF